MIDCFFLSLQGYHLLVSLTLLFLTFPRVITLSYHASQAKKFALVGITFFHNFGMPFLSTARIPPWQDLTEKIFFGSLFYSIIPSASSTSFCFFNLLIQLAHLTKPIFHLIPSQLVVLWNICMAFFNEMYVWWVS